MKKFMLLFGIRILCVIVVCAFAFGQIKITASKFDGAMEAAMKPAFVCKELFGGCLIKLGLFWRSTMPQDKLILVAMAASVDPLSATDSLHFNIDGEIVRLTSIDTALASIGTATECKSEVKTHLRESFAYATRLPDIYNPPRGWVSKQYIVDKDFIAKILKGQEVVVRIDLKEGYVEGIFSRDGIAQARPTFKKFYIHVFGLAGLTGDYSSKGDFL